MNTLYCKSAKYQDNLEQIVCQFKSRPNFFILESSYRDVHRGRYSFIGFEPSEVVRLDGGDALDQVRQKFSAYQNNIQTDITPFYAGILGFISYDYGLYHENVSPKIKEDDVPDVWFGFYKAIITIDHIDNAVHVTSIESQQCVDKVYDDIIACEELFDGGVESSGDIDLSLKSNFSKEGYISAVERARQYIAEGDIYQVNLSQKFSFDVESGLIDALAIYQNLKKNSPSPFGCFLSCDDFKIISSSPERFLQLKNGVLQTRPMKGTAKRGDTPQQDETNKSNLIMSEKERAELLMITDLLRNDLGRVCKYGTVKVVNRREIEEYKTVFQATSTVEGKVDPAKDCFDVLESMLPGGSITGCPKIRSMEIIEELEPGRRGVYTGVMGYITFSGEMDFNVLIRTLVASNNKIVYQVGGRYCL